MNKNSTFLTKEKSTSRVPITKFIRKLKEAIFILFNAAIQEQQIPKYRIMLDSLLCYFQMLYFTFSPNVKNFIIYLLYYSSAQYGKELEQTYLFQTFYLFSMFILYLRIGHKLFTI